MSDIFSILESLKKFTAEKQIFDNTQKFSKDMSNIETLYLYIDKTNRIYYNVFKLHKFAEDKADGFKPLSNFCEYIEVNTEIIKRFPNISGDICQIIDSGNFYIREISLKIDKIKAVNDLISRINAYIGEVKRYLTNNDRNEFTEFERLTEDCLQNITFDTIKNYKVKLENAKERLRDFINQLKAVNGLVGWVKNSINEAKQLFPSMQFIEFEKLVEDRFQYTTFDTISNYNKKLEEARKGLLDFVDQLKVLNDLISQIKTKISKAKRLFTDNEIAVFENLIEDCSQHIAFDTIKNYKIRLEGAKYRLSDVIKQAKEQKRKYIEEQSILIAAEETKKHLKNIRKKKRRIKIRTGVFILIALCMLELFYGIFGISRMMNMYIDKKEYVDGLAAVSIGGLKTRKWGYIDESGKEVIPCKYSNVSNFSEGLAAVSIDGKWGYIDKSGKDVIPCIHGNALDFSGGLAKVRSFGKEIKDTKNPNRYNRWGLIDKNGNMVVPYKYSRINFHPIGLAIVERSNENHGKNPPSVGVIDKNGNEVISLIYHAIYISGDTIKAQRRENNSLLREEFDKHGRRID